MTPASPEASIDKMATGLNSERKVFPGDGQRNLIFQGWGLLASSLHCGFIDLPCCFYITVEQNHLFPLLSPQLDQQVRRAGIVF